MAQIQLTFKVNQTAQTLFDLLSDMQQFASVHPVITRIDPLGKGNYLVYETLKFGILPYSFTYPITVDANRAQQTITINVTIMKLAKVEMLFEIVSQDNFVVVNETITIDSLLPISAILEKTFRKQHTALFANIDNLKPINAREKFEIYLSEYEVQSNGSDGGHHYASTEILLNGEMRRIIVFMDDRTDETFFIKKKPIKVRGHLLDEPNQVLILNDAVIVN